MRTELINQYFQLILATTTPERRTFRLDWARLALTEAEYAALLGKLNSCQNQQVEMEEQGE